MRELFGFVATLIEASGATDRRHSAASAMMVVAAGFTVALSGIGVLICLLTSLWLYEQPMVGDVGAPLVVAGALALVTVLATLILRYKTTSSAPPPSPALNIGAVVDIAETVMKSNKFLVLVGAALIGVALGENSGGARRR